MTAFSSHSVTQFLLAWRKGEAGAFEQLLPRIYTRLGSLANHYIAGQSSGHTLQATALVNEAYIRLTGCQQVDWKDREHFIAMSARMMRRILIEVARSGQYQKRGGGVQEATLDEALHVSAQRSEELV